MVTSSYYININLTFDVIKYHAKWLILIRNLGHFLPVFLHVIQIEHFSHYIKYVDGYFPLPPVKKCFKNTQYNIRHV